MEGVDKSSRISRQAGEAEAETTGEMQWSQHEEGPQQVSSHAAVSKTAMLPLDPAQKGSGGRQGRVRHARIQRTRRETPHEA